VKPEGLLFAYCVVGGFAIFGPILGLVWPENALFYYGFGNAAKPSFSHVLQSFVGFYFGWYRPVSHVLAPYVLGIDFLNPASIVAMNIVFFAIASWLAPIVFLPQAGLGSRVLTSSLILSAPALQSVLYLPVIDSLYIIFAIATIVALERAYLKGGSFLSATYAAAFLSWALAVASKEVGVLTPFIAVPIIFLRRISDGMEMPSWALFQKVARYCGPLAAASVLYYLTYLLQKGAFTTVGGYSSVPGTESLGRIHQLTAVSFNIGFPSADSAWLRWATSGYDPPASMLRMILYAAATLFGAILIFGRKHWSVIAFLGVLVTLVIPIGSVAIHPHHAFPVVIAIAVGVGASVSTLSQGFLRVFRVPAGPVFTATGLLLAAVSLALMHRAYIYNTDVLLTGIHASFLRYNTRLFNDDAFKALIKRRPTFVLIENCPRSRGVGSGSSWGVGSGVGVLNYFGGSPVALGEDYVDDFLPRTINELKQVVDGQGGQLIGLGCNLPGWGHLTTSDPYTVINFSEDLAAMSSGRDIKVSTHSDLYRHLLLRSGWSLVEAEHVWSVGNQAIMELPIPPGVQSIQFDLGAYVPGQVMQSVDVAIDGAAVKTLTFDADHSRKLVSVPVLHSSSGTEEIVFRIKVPISPKEVSSSDDVRSLGIALYGFRLEHNQFQN
jgi:hypothetical protein